MKPMGATDPRLPSLKALHAFSVVMRSVGLRDAAEKLFITPQAVSQQIKILEHQLDVRLFRRTGRTISPTEEAIVLARYVDNGFHDFIEGVRKISDIRQNNRVNINASPYFAANMLIPRLNGFMAIRPQCDIRLKTNVELPDFARDDIDVAIVWGYGGWTDHEVARICTDNKIICCSPALAQRLRQPGDLAKLTLLQPIRSKTLWRDVFAALGAAWSTPHGMIELYDNDSMRRAAVEGLGVGLISEGDARREILMGTLVAPFGEDVFRRMPEEKCPAFHLVTPRSRERLPSVVEFCKWVLVTDWERP